MRFRQVHLDFHTSELIPGIGSRFSKEQFQQMLQAGHVDSITVFSKCHHGWAYHPSEANTIHPELSFDLLGSMIEAAHEIGVNTPVYLSAGLDEKLAVERPEWLTRDAEGRTSWAKHFLVPGYHEFCMNTPYLDILVAQIEEVVQRYDADGIFLDIVGVRNCYCHHCRAAVLAQGGDPLNPADMQPLWENTYKTYTERTNAAVHKHKPGLPVFHNNGHIRRGRRDLARMNTHLELESLPTGGWGYDHFPLSARYAQQLGMDFLGMTGKFHTSWGEFGGYKHPNALRYEAALSLANGARCSIGDQLHPEGLMDEATYTLIGAAYGEVEAKEAWCRDVTALADVGILSVESLQASGQQEERTGASDTGAVRMMLEGKLLFDVLDLEADFSRYRVLILPDRIRVDADLRDKLDAFVRGGGKLLATGRSGLPASDSSDAGVPGASQEPNGISGDQALLAGLGARWIGPSPYQPSYVQTDFPVAGLPSAAHVMYAAAQQIELAPGGKTIAARVEPYFNRQAFRFCSHQHTPPRPEPAGPGMTEGADGIYIAWEVFADYAEKGSLVLRELVLHALDRLLPEPLLRTNLPAQGVVTLQHQAGQQRLVQHLLYGAPVRRGKGIEIIEDLPPLRDIQVQVRTDQPVREVYLAPSGDALPFEKKDGLISYTVPEFSCHQMVVLQY
ncbi:beta-galactosidase trimerization domain-containing protein [Paenibacillus sp. 1P07SE]|uniref:beta-galactosidase trimerization domain-containing protein n=1 Tax=Paenibacillus sp. 1P07SE TaxID=3132209 RepID=UPI0039A632B7